MKEKKRKDVLKKKLIHRLCKSDMKAAVEEHVSSENLPFCWPIIGSSHLYINHFSTNRRETEAFQELVSPEVYKLIHSVINEKQGVKYSFYQKEDFKTRLIDS